MLVVLGGFTLSFTLNTVWTFGNMEPYIVSYIRNRSHPTGLQENIGPWIFTALIVGQGTTMLLGGFLYRKVGPRVTTLSGAAIYSSGVLLSYFTIQTSFWLFALTYGFMVGLGVGIVYVSPLAAAMKWVPDWKGVANGIVLAGYGVGILSFNFIQTTFANPNNIAVETSNSEEKYFTDPQVLDRIPYTFLLLGGSSAVLQLLGSVLLTDPPEHYLHKKQEEESPAACSVTKTSKLYDKSSIWACCRKVVVENEKCVALMEPDTDGTSKLHLKHCSPSDKVDSDLYEHDNETEETEQLLQEKKVLSEEIEPPSPPITGNVAYNNVVVSLQPLQMLKQFNFYLLWLIIFFNSSAQYFVITYYKVFGFTFIADDHFLAAVGSVGAICDTAGCIAGGLLADKLGYKVAFVILNAVFTVFLLTFYASSMAGKPMYIIWACVLWFTMAGSYTMYPTAVARSFGVKYVSTNYALLFSSQVVASILSSLIDTFLIDLITMYGVMFLVSGLLFVSFVLSIFYQHKRYVLLSV